MDEENKHKKEKYIKCYTKGTKNSYDSGQYGSKNWGYKLYDYIKTLNIKSILDIGCGHGEFPNDMKNKFEIDKVYGLDIASIKTGKHIENDDINWIESQAHDIPLENNSVEYITSFDVLEHCLEKDIDKIVDEFYRVCIKGLFLKIAYRQATKRSLNGEKLHMTVHNEKWWINKFKRKFKFDSKIKSRYLCFKKEK